MKSGNDGGKTTEHRTREWMAARTRRSFITGSLTAAAAYSGFAWITSRRPASYIPWPLRRMLDLNGELAQDFYGRDRLSPSFAPPPAGKKPRVNGDVGLSGGFDPAKWRMSVTNDEQREAAGDEPLLLSAADLKWLPRVSTTTEFKCIEGWSEVISYSGYRFSDFMKHFELGTRDDDRLFPYVGFETPDRGYYVSIDIDSMMHPQTLLVDEMNGAPLSLENGAPLRLVIPVKYGIKSLKRIGSIRFASTRPPDYWAERGYDWFAGL